MHTTERKKYGVVYTTPKIVDFILNKALPANPEDLKYVSLCEPASGRGAFLTAFARRALENLSKSDALNVLQRMGGYDIDTEAISKCKLSLDHIVNEHYPGSVIDWCIIPRNALNRSAFIKDKGRYSHVVGNPPYVRVQNLEQEGRALVEGQWEVLKGSTDLYLLFYELGLDLLQPGGTLAYITPSSWLRSQSGGPLRELLATNHRVTNIYDFAEHQVFNEVTTYTAITVIEKNREFILPPVMKFNGESFVDGGVVHIETDTIGGPWIASTPAEKERLDNLMNRGPRLGELVNIHVGIQTLADNIFIRPIASGKKISQIRGEMVPCEIDGEELELEKWILRDILKASVMKNGEDVTTRALIYPYDAKGKLLTERLIQSKAPAVYEYLKQHKTQLLSRDKGKIEKARWYAFGRSVSITSGFGEKILTSGINKSPNFQLITKKSTTFYSGYCIKPKKKMCLETLLTVLNSDDMDFFIKHTSKPYQSGWMSYAKSFIKNFTIPTYLLYEMSDGSLK